MHFRTATLDDLPRLIILHQAVAGISGGIARKKEEVTEAYVRAFIEKSLASGQIVVAENDHNADQLVAEIHASKPGIALFDHVLTDLTILVHPDFQGQGVGRAIFLIFLDEIVQHRPDIGKVELFTSEGNARAISLYQSLGFEIEGRMEMRCKLDNGKFEADIPMGWINPGFEFDGNIPRLNPQ